MNYKEDKRVERMVASNRKSREATEKFTRECGRLLSHSQLEILFNHMNVLLKAGGTVQDFFKLTGDPVTNRRLLKICNSSRIRVLLGEVIAEKKKFIDHALRLRGSGIYKNGA